MNKFGGECPARPPQLLGPLLAPPQRRFDRLAGIRECLPDLPVHNMRTNLADGISTGQRRSGRVPHRSAVGGVFYCASTMLCPPASMGEHVGEKRLREVVTQGGFTRFRRATETPFNLVFEARL